jgi:hypothetical protein
MDYNKNFDILGIDLITDNNDVSGVRYVQTVVGANIISTELFKLHARIDFDTDDALVELYVTAAQQALEQWSQLSFSIRTMRLTALSIPNNYKLMFGPVNGIITTGFTNVGDILKEGGTDVQIDFTTLGFNNVAAIEVAVARYAAGLYINRENIVDTKMNASEEMDKAKEMLSPFMNLTFL